MLGGLTIHIYYRGIQERCGMFRWGIAIRISMGRRLSLYGLGDRSHLGQQFYFSIISFRIYFSLNIFYMYVQGMDNYTDYRVLSQVHISVNVILGFFPFAVFN